MINKLRRKFVMVNMLIVTVMLAVIFGLIISFTRSNMEQESIQMLRSVSMLPAQPEHGDNEHISTAPFVFTIHKTPGGEYLATGNRVIDFSDSTLISELYEYAVGADDFTGEIKDYKLRFFVSSTPPFQEVIFADISSEKTMLRQLLQTCSFIAVLSFGVFFVISILLAHWTVKPVEKAWNEQKQFVADASHELKTPLTVIMTNAEMLLDNQHSEEKQKQFSENILTMSRQMRELTESLLELARNDNHTAAVIFDNLDFSQLVTEAALPFEPLYYEKTLELCCDVDSNIFVNGDKNHLMRLVEILLDNAMKYSYPNTSIDLSLKNHGGSCILSVASRGDSISKADLKNIFKRFYRVDKARTSSHSYGLGLSIAESIANEHHGKIRAESNNGINTFYVRLPMR